MTLSTTIFILTLLLYWSSGPANAYPSQRSSSQDDDATETITLSDYIWRPQFNKLQFGADWIGNPEVTTARMRHSNHKRLQEEMRIRKQTKPFRRPVKKALKSPKICYIKLCSLL